MSHTSGSTSSPIPISPFSPSPFSANSDSHYTSDDQPDLGAFRTVLREWVYLQPPPRIPVWAPSIPTVTVSGTQVQTQTRTMTTTETEGQQSTVWNQRPIADYLQASLSSISRVEESDSGSDVESMDEPDTDTDTEGARTVEIEIEDGRGGFTPSPLRTAQSLDDDSQSLPVDGIDDRDEHVFAVDDRSISIASTLSSLPLQLRRLSLTPSPSPRPDHSESTRSERLSYESARSSSPPQSQVLAEVESTTSVEEAHIPSLGYLDEALSFIAAERARWTAQREAGEWRHVIEPSSSDGEHRRKRRKKRAPGLVGPSLSISSDEILSIHQGTAAVSIGSDSYSDEEGWARTISGLSKSTPTTPRARSHVRPARPTIVTAISTTTPSSIPYPRDPRPSGSHDLAATTTTTTTPASPQRSRTKKTKKLKHHSKHTPDPPQIQILTHSRSTPALRSLITEDESQTSTSADTNADDPTGPPRPRLRLRARSKPPPGATLQLPPLFPPGGETGSSAESNSEVERARLMGLARELRVLFPEEREELRDVEGRLLRGERADRVEAGSTGGVHISGVKRGKRKRGRRDEGENLGDRVGDTTDGGTEMGVGGLDPRGRDVREGDPLVHVFIDHSNILIGLLNHLKRHPRHKTSSHAHSSTTTTSPTRRRKALSLLDLQSQIPAENPEDEGRDTRRGLRRHTGVGGSTDGGKDTDGGGMDRRPRPPKQKPPNTEVGQDGRDVGGKANPVEVGGGEVEAGDTGADVSITGKEKGKDIIGETPDEVLGGDRGTRMRMRIGLTGRERVEEGGKKGGGRVSRPLPPVPTTASTPGATRSVTTSSSNVSSTHTTPIPLPSFATAGKVGPKTGGAGGLVSETVALKIFGISGPEAGTVSVSAPASTVHLPASASTSSGPISRHSPAATTNTNTETVGTTPPVSPRKRVGKTLTKPVGVLPETKHSSKKTGNPGVDGVGTKEGSGDSSREGHEGSDSTRGPTETKKRFGRHLSHTALALILERGRPITRRVLVTSSPLYQPMDTMERLGYEVRVYLRVPDLGDGMDRERHKSLGGHRRRHSGGGSGSGTGTSGGGGSPKKKAKEHGHTRHTSGTTHAELTGTSAGESSAKASPFTPSDRSSHAQSHLHLYERHALGHPLHPLFPHHEYLQHHKQASRGSLYIPNSGSGPGASPGSASGGVGAGTLGSPARIRYREQGVDELLQLKLHQALAAVDTVPEGATIVLATGDGNVGQFNEDGFLGPVRTALKRGWRVELYAWEDGLSRAWKREFGEGSEWGQGGKFRVIAMEQFAQSLVEESH